MFVFYNLYQFNNKTNDIIMFHAYHISTIVIIIYNYYYIAYMKCMYIFTAAQTLDIL